MANRPRTRPAGPRPMMPGANTVGVEGPAFDRFGLPSYEQSTDDTQRTAAMAMIEEIARRRLRQQQGEADGTSVDWAQVPRPLFNQRLG